MVVVLLKEKLVAELEMVLKNKRKECKNASKGSPTYFTYIKQSIFYSSPHSKFIIFNQLIMQLDRKIGECVFPCWSPKKVL